MKRKETNVKKKAPQRRKSSKGHLSEEGVLSLYAQGQTYEEIAETENISVQEAVNLIKNKEEKAETLKAVAMQNYIKENHLDSRSRIEILCVLRNALLGTIKESNLEEIPPEKLVSLFLKVNEQLREEIEGTPRVILSETQQLRQERDRALSQYTT